MSPAGSLLLCIAGHIFGACYRVVPVAGPSMRLLPVHRGRTCCARLGFDPKRTCCTSDIEGAAERPQTLVNKKSRAARSRSNAARPSPTGGISRGRSATRGHETKHHRVAFGKRKLAIHIEIKNASTPAQIVSCQLAPPSIKAAPTIAKKAEMRPSIMSVQPLLMAELIGRTRSAQVCWRF